MAKKSNPPIPVSLDNEWDVLCRELLQRGIIHRRIAEITGLPSPGRVSYRSKQFGVSSQDYRRGMGAVALEAIRGAKLNAKNAGCKHRDLQAMLTQRGR